MALFIRMAIYTLAAMAAAMGFGELDHATGKLTLDLEQIAVALASAGVINSAVVWLWGKT